jgi:hypothetical protein
MEADKLCGVFQYLHGTKESDGTGVGRGRDVQGRVTKDLAA